MYNNVRFSDCPDPDNVSVLDMAILPMVSDMHKFGIRLDIPFLQSLTREIVQAQREIEFELDIHLGSYQDFNGKIHSPFKISSPNHVSRLLFEELKVQADDIVPMTPKGKRFTTSDDILEQYRTRSPVVALVLDWREMDKLRGTYTEPLQTLVDSESRLHPRFNVTVVSTGRLSASYVQTIPTHGIGKRVRNAFIASPGCVLVSLDLSQSEMRWAAHGSQDENMLNVFRHNEDIHARTACDIFGRDYETIMALPPDSAEAKRFKQEERLPSKTLGFGVLYGVFPPTLQKQIILAGGPSWTEEQCAGFIEKFFSVYPSLRNFMELQYRRARRYAMVWCAFGRPRLVPEAKSTHKRIVNEGTRKAGNHYEQASSQGNVKLAMAELNVLCRKISKSHRCWPLLQGHDSILLDVDKRVSEDFLGQAKPVMENAVPASIPMLSSNDTAERWGEM